MHQHNKTVVLTSGHRQSIGRKRYSSEILPIPIFFRCSGKFGGRNFGRSSRGHGSGSRTERRSCLRFCRFENQGNEYFDFLRTTILNWCREQAQMRCMCPQLQFFRGHITRRGRGRGIVVHASESCLRELRSRKHSRSHALRSRERGRVW